MEIGGEALLVSYLVYVDGILSPIDLVILRWTIDTHAYFFAANHM